MAEMEMFTRCDVCVCLCERKCVCNIMCACVCSPVHACAQSIQLVRAPDTIALSHYSFPIKKLRALSSTFLIVAAWLTFLVYIVIACL